MAEGLRTLLRTVGELLVTLGVVVLLFCVYELQVTGLYTGREQDALSRDLSAQWAAPPTPSPAAAPVGARTAVALGAGVAVLHVPRLGRDWSRVVLEGVSGRTLQRGPGHYPGTALPGEVGNTVLSGHRTTYGAPFADLDRVRPGDELVLETRDRWFTYRATGTLVVRPTAVEVTYPVPGKRGARPRERLLTLTTCHPKYSARLRLVLHARLASSLPKGPGVVPPALSGP